MTMTAEQATWFSDIFGRLVANVDQVLMGKTFVIRLGFTALLSEGHLLLEDYPGTGKTSFARAMAQSVAGTTNRIQFTPDLLPGDITGVSVNGTAATLTTNRIGVADWTVELAAPKDGKLTAKATDNAGNAEQTAHVRQAE